MTGTLWRLGLTVPDAGAAAAAVAALEGQAVAVSAFEAAGGWRVEAYAERAPDLATLAAAAALADLALGAAGAALFAGLEVERLAPRDWVRENQQSFPPLAIGRFLVHGSHHQDVVPAGRIGLLIDAASAFGTGEHATTRGCLLALDGLVRRRRFRRPLDVGTGTGILAMAAARLWRVPVLASDIDPGALAVAAENLRRNGLATGRARVRLRRADGYADSAIRAAAPFDLVIANILARPLADMAGALAAVLSPNGVAVLSGLLSRQAPLVLAAHRAHGLRLARRITVAGWDTLVLAR